MKDCTRTVFQRWLKPQCDCTAMILGLARESIERERGVFIETSDAIFDIPNISFLFLQERPITSANALPNQLPSSIRARGHRVAGSSDALPVHEATPTFFHAAVDLRAPFPDITFSATLPFQIGPKPSFILAAERTVSQGLCPTFNSRRGGRLTMMWTGDTELVRILYREN